MATLARTAHWCAAVLIFNKVEKISKMMRGSVSDAARLAAESGGPARWTCCPVGPWARGPAELRPVNRYTRQR